jgi:hypothetical protein
VYDRITSSRVVGGVLRAIYSLADVLRVVTVAVAVTGTFI